MQEDERQAYEERIATWEAENTELRAVIVRLEARLGVAALVRSSRR